ncbi:MAG: hypothetical protein A2551_04090 [Elusimicrobia bacterium RIFOXYD2_FULL_34_30]|nr:MAG: hypothetical protein A2551_04090 [Elusimicrobia bacterium RIFOXYD2_FULL_34_30]
MHKENDLDANNVLYEVVISKDMRLWNGFPVILANSVKKDLFDFNKTMEYLKNRNDKNTFCELVALSLALYDNLKFNFSWSKELYNFLNPNYKEKYKNYLKDLDSKKDLLVAKFKISTEQLKGTFRNYFLEEKVKLKELLELKDEYTLEFALSQVFSPKQKELFYKKLKNEKLTKTDKEYFSRTVKKKLLALANEELHSLAQKLL